MQNNVDPSVAQAAMAMRQRAGNLADLGAKTWPTTPFGQLLALYFDRGMTPEEWLPIDNPLADPVLLAAMSQIWLDVVLAAFAKWYGLTL